MSTTLEQLQYGFDRDSRRTWRQRATTQGWDNAYVYDTLSQVIGDDRGDLNLAHNAIAGVPANGSRWQYDETGNWHGYETSTNGSVVLNQSRTHDKGNRLMEVSDAAAMRTDRAGRMVQVVPGPAGNWDNTWQVTWDAWSRITQINRPEGNEIHKYAYDGLTRRIKRYNNQTGVTLHSYYNDEWRPVEERKESENTAATSYLWGSRHRDDLVRKDRAVGGATLNESRYILMDYFSPAAITNEAGDVTERYQFSAFGLRTILNPDFTVRGDSECAMEFAFQGQFLDFESGLMNYGFRYYSPYLGRWPSRDPIGENGGVNLYGMVGNDPVNRVDYLGLYDKKVGKGGIVTLKVEECEIIILDGHGSNTTPHKFEFPNGNSCGAGGGYLGCYPGVTNSTISGENGLNGAPSDNNKREDMWDNMAAERRAIFNGAVTKAGEICECCEAKGKRTKITVVDTAPQPAWYDVISTSPENDVVFDFDCKAKKATRKSGGHKHYYDF